jgi:hypothetical protein
MHGQWTAETTTHKRGNWCCNLRDWLCLLPCSQSHRLTLVPLSVSHSAEETFTRFVLAFLCHSHMNNFVFCSWFPFSSNIVFVPTLFHPPCGHVFVQCLCSPVLPISTPPPSISTCRQQMCLGSKYHFQPLNWGKESGKTATTDAPEMTAGVTAMCSCKSFAGCRKSEQWLLICVFQRRMYHFGFL